MSQAVPSISSSTTTSPRGEQFDVLGAAPPVEAHEAPGLLAESRHDVLVIKEGALFVCSRRNGDIGADRVLGEGLFYMDTRFLSEFKLTLGGKPPVLLSSSDDLAYAMVIDATNPNLTESGQIVVPQQTLSIRRFRFLADRLYERITVRNFGAPISTRLDLVLGADFADTFEVRGFMSRDERGQKLAAKPSPGGLRFAYVGQDRVFRESLVTFRPEPSQMDIQGVQVQATWRVELDQGKRMSLLVTAEPSVGGKRRRARSPETAEAKVRASHESWRASGTWIRTDNELFNGFVDAAVRDLRALTTPLGSGEVLAAGIPWYVAPFGRDSLLASYESLILNPARAISTLEVLASLQAVRDDPWRDAEPGKIPHELRVGELAGAGLIPHTPYYGTIDATPLFLILAAACYRWTADLEPLKRLRPHLDRALSWISQSGDLDGDGFIEYHRRSAGGLKNQGWKDSEDCIVHINGKLAEGPIALVEVQGYVYQAKMGIAEVYQALGDGDRAAELRREAAELKVAFDRAFWMPEEGFYAMALDGHKRQVGSISSNPGHCLEAGILDPPRARLVAERLLAPDMFSGWGIRTLSSESVGYNPMGYHTGSVWPHENAIIAAGCKRYGLEDATETIASALFDAAAASSRMRLAELYCGFQRREGLPPVPYPVACSPQAWAAAVPLMLVEALMGFNAQAPEGMLSISHPRLPEWLQWMEMENFSVGGAKLKMEFSRNQRHTSFSLIEKNADLRVTIEQ
jgi:glycogen debranching enzyme